MPVLGTPIYVTSGNAYTVPTGALGVAFMWAYYHGTAGNGINSISLGGAGTFAIRSDLPTATLDQSATGVATAQVNTTGSQTVTFSFDATPVEGPTCWLVFFDTIDPADFFRSSGADQGQSTDAVSVTSSSQTTDTVVVMEQKFNAVPATPATGWTSLASQAVTNSEGSRVLVATSPGATNTTYDGQGEDYTTVVMLVVKAGSAGSAWEGSGRQVSSGQGTLTTRVELSGGGRQVASAVGTLTVPTGLQGQGQQVSHAQGTLTTRVALAGVGVQVSAGLGSLGSPVALIGAGQNVSFALGTLHVPFRNYSLMGSDISAWKIKTRYAAQDPSSVSLSGTGLLVSVGLGALTVRVALAGQGHEVSIGQGSITVRVALAGQGNQASQASGNLTTRAALSATGRQTSQGQGSLQISGGFAGQGQQTSQGQGVLTTRVQLAGSGQQVSFGIAVMIPGSSLVGSGRASSQGQGTLTARVAFVGDGLAQSSGQGTLLARVLLVGTGSADAEGEGALGIDVSPLQGTGLEQSAAQGSLTISVSLEGVGFASAYGRGALSSGADQYNPGNVWRVPAENRIWTVKSGNTLLQFNNGSTFVSYVLVDGDKPTIEKTPEAALFFGINVADMLATAVTVASFDVFSDDLQQSDKAVVDGNKLIVKLSGGNAGTVAAVRFVWLTSSGETDSRYIYIVVKPR